MALPIWPASHSGARASVSRWGDRVPAGKRARDSAIVPLSTRVKSAFCAAEGVPILTDAEFLFQAVRAAGSHARFAGITGGLAILMLVALRARAMAEPTWCCAPRTR